MCAGGHLGSRERAQPDAGLLIGFAHFADPTAGVALPHAFEDGVASLAELSAAGAAFGRGGGDRLVSLFVGIGVAVAAIAVLERRHSEGESGEERVWGELK